MKVEHHWRCCSFSCPKRFPRRGEAGLVQEAARVHRGALLLENGLVLDLRHLHADEGEQVGVLALHVRDLGLRLGELRLELHDLLLELRDRARAAVHRVSDPRARLVDHAAHRIGPSGLRELLIKFTSPTGLVIEYRARTFD